MPTSCFRRMTSRERLGPAPVVSVRGAEERMNDTLNGPRILSALKASGIEVVVSVPDIVTSEGLLRPISTDPDLRHVRVCKEDEGSVHLRRPVLLRHARAPDDAADRHVRFDERDTGHRRGLRVAGLHAESACRGRWPIEDPRPLGEPYRALRPAGPGRRRSGAPPCCAGAGGDVPAIVPAIDGAYRRSRPVALFVGAMLPGRMSVDTPSPAGRHRPRPVIP